MFIKNSWVIIMVWFTIIVIYAVSQIDHAIRSSSGFQNVEFANSPIPVTVTHPGNDNISVVPMDSNTVWIIDRASMTVSVITKDKSGQFHVAEWQTYNRK